MDKRTAWRLRVVAACMLLAGATLGGRALPASAAHVPTAFAPSAARVPLYAIAGLPADAPFNVTDQITDRAGVLGGELNSLRRVLDHLRSEHGLQLFIVYVNSFNGASGETWSQQTFNESGMGGDDVLLAVAVQDRRYGTYTTGDSGLTSEQDNIVRSDFIEPRLADNDWAGAVRAAAEGYGQAKAGDLGAEGRPPNDVGTEAGNGGFSPWWLLLPAGGIVLVALARRRSSAGRGGLGAGQAGEPPLTTEELTRRAATALVEVDDAIRASAEELAFAEAEFGLQATRRFKEALEEANAKAAEAFRLQREMDDLQVSGPLDDVGRRQRLLRIIELASSADRALDDQEAEFTRMRNLQATVPQFLGELRVRLEEVRRRIPVAEQELAGLAVQHPAEALRTVSSNVTQARQLLESAEGFIDQGHDHLAGRRQAGGTAADSPAGGTAPERPRGEDRGAAVAAARAAEEAIGQADQLLSSVRGAREELAQAANRLDRALASIAADIADAERLGANDELTQTALAAAREAIAHGTAARNGGDPLAALRTLSRAEKDLDHALARYRADEEQERRSRQLFEQRLALVRARLASIDELISSRRGAVGTGARSRIVNAMHLCGQAMTVSSSDLVQAGALLDQAEAEGEEALRLAQDDINSWGGGFRGGYPGTVLGPRGLDPTSLVLGGILTGGFGGRGGGWGGSHGGFGGGFGDSGGFGGGGRF